MSSFFPDYKYFDLIKPLPPTQRKGPMNIRSPHLKKVLDAWRENIWRTASFCLFPAEVAATALQKQLWQDYAIFRVTGKLTPNEKRRFSEKIQKAISKEIEKRKKAWKKEFFFASGMEAGNRRRMTVGVEHINRLLNSEIGAMQSMNNILFSVVIESWIAFETLAADLFYKALDHGPSEWRIRVQARYSEFERGSNWEPAKVLPPTLHDPQKNYGSSLQDQDAISFRRLRLIKFWYGTAFGENVGKLFGRVDGGYIRGLAAVRNIIAHKAGKADATYLNEVKKFPELQRVGYDKLIQLDGEIVRKLRNAGINLGRELILHIDHALPNS